MLLISENFVFICSIFAQHNISSAQHKIIDMKFSLRENLPSLCILHSALCIFYTTPSTIISQYLQDVNNKFIIVPNFCVLHKK